MQAKGRTGIIHLRVDKELETAFRGYVFKLYGTTYKSGDVLNEILKEGLEKRGVTIPQASPEAV